MIYLINVSNGNILPVEDGEFLSDIIDFFRDDLDRVDIYVQEELECIEFVDFPDCWYMSEDFECYGICSLMEEKLLAKSDLSPVEFLDSQEDPESRGDKYVYVLEDIRGEKMKIRITTEQFQAMDRIQYFSGCVLNWHEVSQEVVVDYTN